MNQLKAHASPTKEFFVQMITKDISLEDCILDLIDNAIDGARKTQIKASAEIEGPDFSRFSIHITFDSERFEIRDNCGGISLSEAVDYAFHFGRRPDALADGDFTIGLYGIGMKRAMFKLGRTIEIVSSTEGSAFKTSIDVLEWIRRKSPLPGAGGQTFDDWDFDISEIAPIVPAGTSINVSALLPDVSNRFSDPAFLNGLARIVSRDYSQFLAQGLQVEINTRAITGYKFTVLESEEFKPMRISYADPSGVNVEIIAGMAGVPPDDLMPSNVRSETDYFGWFVLCNGRVVVAADKSSQTVWGDSGFPSWHFQYNGFIGVVAFSSRDPKLLPWRTTKRDVDVGNDVYRRAIERMKAVTRVWIDYTNESPRVLRRLLNLRNWSHDEYTKDPQAKIFAGTA